MGQTKNFFAAKFANLNTKTKVFAVAAVPILLTVGIVFIAVTSMKNTRQSEHWVNHTHYVLAQASIIVADAVDMETGMRGFLLAGTDNFLEPFEAGREHIFTTIDSLAETVNDNPGQVARLGEVRDVMNSWLANVVNPMIATRRLVGTSVTMDEIASEVRQARGKTYFDQFRALMNAFSAEEQELLVIRQMSNDEALNQSERNILIASATTILLGGLVAFLIGNSLSSAIRRLTTSMSALANNDTSTKITDQSRKDEVGEMASALEFFRMALIEKTEIEAAQTIRDEQQSAVVTALSAHLSALSNGAVGAKIHEDFPPDYQGLRADFNETTTRLKSTIENLVLTTESIRNGSQQISQASDELARRTENQAATLEQTAAGLEEMSVSVSATSASARSVENIMHEAQKEAEHSGSIVEKTVVAMRNIEDSSNQVVQIINVIDDIAFQTNLLALNAGVEAARAGESGKGFAVVASEVRALSHRCAEAASEIKTLIGESSKQVESGVDLVNQAGTSLTAIIKRVSDISSQITEIADGATEQASGLSNMNDGVSNLDNVAQQNAAMVEESTAASHQLFDDANALSKLVAFFNLNDTPITSKPLNKAA